MCKGIILHVGLEIGTTVDRLNDRLQARRGYSHTRWSVECLAWTDEIHRSHRWE